MFENVNFTVFDLETTGLDPNLGHRIVEIGALRMESHGADRAYQTLVNPERPIPASAAAIHNITDDMVKASPTIRQVLPEFLDFCKDSVIVAHNARFDLKFLSFSMNEYSMPPLDNIILDSIKLARRFYPNLESYSLPSLRRIFELDCNEEHRALADVMATAELLKKCLVKAEEEGISSIDSLQEAQGGPISFLLPSMYAKPILPYKIVHSLLKAMDSGEQIRILYRDVTEAQTERMVTPRRFVKFGLHIYMVAHCHRQQTDRTFRMDKILLPE
jgi:DNA polymerase III epsilon subunit